VNMPRYKNEEKVKDMIVDGHSRGVCDRNGDSVKRADGTFTAKPSIFSSVARTYVFRKGKMVLKNG